MVILLTVYMKIRIMSNKTLRDKVYTGDRMKELKSIYKVIPHELEEVDFGYIRLKLKKYLDENGITRNHLADMCGTKFQTVDRYYKSERMEKISMSLLAKMCYVLDCRADELIEYVPPGAT